MDDERLEEDSLEEERQDRKILRMTRGYERKKVIDPVTNEYTYVIIYTGNYYRRPIGGARLWQVKLTYVLLTLLGIVLYLLAASRRLPVNMAWITSFAQTIWILCALIGVCCLVKFLAASVELKEKDYRMASVWLKRFALFNAAVSIATALIALVFLLFSNGDRLATLLCVLAYTVSGASSFALFFLEHRTHYTVRQSEGGPEDEI